MTILNIQVIAQTTKPKLRQHQRTCRR